MPKCLMPLVTSTAAAADGAVLGKTGMTPLNMRVSGTSSIALGNLSLAGPSSSDVVAIGHSILTNAAVNVSNIVAIGNNAMELAGAGAIGNIAIGQNSLKTVTGGSNVAIGGNAGQSVTGGSSNILIGGGAGGGLTTGTRNICIGLSAAAGAAALIGGIAIGYSAAATGNYSTALGHDTTALGAGSVAIGCDSTGNGVTTTSTVNRITLGNTNHTTYLPGMAVGIAATPDVTAHLTIGGLTAFNSAAQVRGIQCGPTNSGVGSMVGIASKPISGGVAGNVALMWGFDTNINISKGSGSIITDAICYNISAPTIAVGCTVTNHYGLYVPSIKTASITNSYGVYQAGTTDTNLFNGLVTHGEGANIAVGTVTGTKIGTTATQKLGFWGAVPVVQDVNGWAASGLTPRRSWAVTNTTLDEISNVLGTLVTTLKSYGLLR